MMHIFTSLITALAGLATVQASGKDPLPKTPPPPQHQTQKQLLGINQLSTDLKFPSLVASSTGSAYFQQYLDHSNKSLGTFGQWYFYNTQYWEGPGSPIILFTPGETNATRYAGYSTAATMMGTLAQQVGGAVIILEHRYWGNSSPFTDLTTANMQYLTLDNALQDLTNFANNVDLPFDNSGNSTAENAPWVLVGGSYSGALSAWTAAVNPGTFWAYHASSAPVEVIQNFWQYYTPIQQGMPKNCSRDLNLVIPYMDKILMSGNQTAITSLKTQFGMEAIQHNDDFMDALLNGPWLWQSNQFYTNAGFSIFCDFVENAIGVNNATVPGAKGVGLTKALQGYANWALWYFPTYCESFTQGYFTGANNFSCFDTYNPNNPMFLDTSLNNGVDRQWRWMLCNQPFGFDLDGAPKGTKTIASRLVTSEYWERECALYFPTGPNGQTFGQAKGATTAMVNAFTGGWSVANYTRLQFTNGQFDPWRSAGVSSQYRPGGPLQSTSKTPVNIVPGGFHCSDLYTASGIYNNAAKTVITQEIANLVQWVKEWNGSGSK